MNGDPIYQVFACTTHYVSDSESGAGENSLPTRRICKWEVLFHDWGSDEDSESVLLPPYWSHQTAAMWVMDDLVIFSFSLRASLRRRPSASDHDEFRVHGLHLPFPSHIVQFTHYSSLRSLQISSSSRPHSHRHLRFYQDHSFHHHSQHLLLIHVDLPSQHLPQWPSLQHTRCRCTWTCSQLRGNGTGCKGVFWQGLFVRAGGSLFSLSHADSR